MLMVLEASEMLPNHSMQCTAVDDPPTDSIRTAYGALASHARSS